MHMCVLMHVCALGRVCVLRRRWIADTLHMEHSCVSLVCALMHVYLLMHHVCIYAMSLHTMCLSSHHACVYHCVHLCIYMHIGVHHV